MKIIDRLKKTLNRIVDIDMSDFGLDTKLNEIELDSLKRIDLVMNLEEEFDTSIDDDIFEHVETVGELVNELKDES